MPVLTVYNPEIMGKEIKRGIRVDVRFSREDVVYVELLMEKTGLGKTGVIVSAIRELATTKGITPHDVREALAKQDAAKEGEG